MSHLSPSEKKGILLAVGLILIGFFVQIIQPHFVQTDLYDYSVQDSIFKARSAITSPKNSSRLKSRDSVVISGENKYYKKEQKRNRNELTFKSININTASKKELEKLPRIGPATAQNIIDYRQENGLFKNYKDITKVKRIGPKTLELIKPYIIISDSLN